MLLLALDTSTPAVTVAVAEVSGAERVCVLDQRDEVAARRHGEVLSPLIEATLEHARVPPADLDALAVGIGPGPFTGLRVGLVTAVTMAAALDVPAYAVCSLDALAADHAGEVVVPPRRCRGHPPAATSPPRPSTSEAAHTVASPDTQLEDARASGRSRATFDGVVMTDARRREVYWARYADGARVEGPAVDRPSELADRWPGGTRLAGPGAAAYRETLERYAVEDRAPYPSAASIAQLGATRAWTEAPGEPLTPLYLRRPDAAMPRDATAVLGP